MGSNESGDVDSEPSTQVRHALSRQFWNRAFVIFGISGLAVAQPILDLFGNNPEFFVAGNYGSAQIILFALIVALVPPAVGCFVVAGATLINERTGSIAFSVVTMVFGAAFALAVLRTIGVDPIGLVVLLALAAGGALMYVVVRTQGGRLLATYLSAANLVFVGLFVLSSPASRLVTGGSDSAVGDLTIPELGGPVVVIVLDEFPAATIMRPDGTINADRFPGFADLASVSTWFRNASSQYHLTHRAVPSILDGRIPDEDDLPIAADHPRNLFTLLGNDIPVVRYESVTDLCPSSICDEPDRQSIFRALKDASIVYGHRVLPAALRDELPAIDNSWGSYGAEDSVGAGTSEDADGQSYIEQAYTQWTSLGADERSPSGQAGVMQDNIEAIGAEPAVHFVHVALPHRPWVLSRTGITTSYVPELVRDPADPSYEFESRLEFQIHSMQVGAADALISELLDQLRSLPDWEDTLLVVTSDHGTNLTPPKIGRMRITDENREEIYRVPLFIKAPGQTDGDVRDTSAQTIDILPSIIDLLGIDAEWEFDGHSLFDGSEPHTAPLVSTDVDAVLAIARDRGAEFPYSDNWIGLAAVGDNGDLVGRDVDEFSLGDVSDWSIRLRDADLFASLPTESGQMPFALTGTVSGPAEPPELLVAVNGRFAGVVGGYRPDGNRWEFYGYVADLYRTGSNDVVVYEAVRDAGDVTLREVEQP